ncbi:MAG: amidohydrolase [Treponema sp.]|nr:amidohydrolase [Treponema sp.]
MKAIYNARVRIKAGEYRQAILIDGARVAMTGTTRDVLRALPAGAEKIDAQGALAIPAFFDSHLHFMWLGRRAGSVECAGAKSVEEVIERARRHIAKERPPAGAYVLGYGVNPDQFSEGPARDLCRQDIDKISRDHPIILSRNCGHTIYCNSLALERAGLCQSAPDVEGGAFEKDENGRPTGVARENAAVMILAAMPAYTRGQLLGFARKATAQARVLGIAACGSYDSDGADFNDVSGAYLDLCEEERAAGRPPLRVSMQCGISLSDEILDERLRDGPFPKPLWRDDRWGTFLQLGAIKIFVDGTLGGRTAWMSLPYLDMPGASGFPLLDEAALGRFTRKAAQAGAQVLAHAIGDACIESVVGAFERVLVDGKNPLRHGIIHCQFTRPDLLDRMARAGILALVQPIFLEDDIRVVESRIDPRLAQSSYAWASMISRGVPTSFGTDAPVTGLDPLRCISWAALRSDPENPGTHPGGFLPAEKVGADRAFDAYSLASAQSAFWEASLGRIAPGFFADIALLDKDIFAIDPAEIHAARVLRTLCAGETVYSV